jgi:acetyl-CoA/propionyl-CoA carboxylase biotin carboxyl carrier protein
VHTRWIETEWTDSEAAAALAPAVADPSGDGPPAERRMVVVEVSGRRLEVTLPGELFVPAAAGPARPAAGRAGRRSGGHKAAAAPTSALVSPMQATVVKVAVADGDTVAEGDLVVVLEAMKMEQPLTAHRAGTVKGLSLSVGATVTAGTVLCEID